MIVPSQTTRPEAGSAGDPPLADALGSTARALLERILEPGFRLPMLPAIAVDALAVVFTPEVSFQAVDRVLRRDPLLAARVVGLASSPAYGATTKVTSLRAALLRLGCTALRDVLSLAVAEAHVFHGAKSRALRTQFLHAAATAHVTSRLARICRAGSDDAFICGLFHDLGRPLLLQIATQEPALAALWAEEDVAFALHTLVGAEVATRWSLPEVVVEAVARHHDWREDEHRGYSRIGNVVAVADRIVQHHGLGRGPAVALDPSTDDACMDLGLEVDEIQELIDSTATLRSELQA